jgi:hypothetical protein
VIRGKGRKEEGGRRKKEGGRRQGDEGCDQGGKEGRRRKERVMKMRYYIRTKFSSGKVRRRKDA